MKFPEEKELTLMDLAEWENENNPNFIELSPRQYTVFNYVAAGDWKTFRGKPVVKSEEVGSRTLNMIE